MSKENLERGIDDWVFQNGEECEEFCNKLNEKIKEVQL